MTIPAGRPIRKRGATQRNEQTGGAPGASEKLQKVLARRGFGSRREMEDWIRAGRIIVNGTTAQLGARVGSGDEIEVDGQALRSRTETRLPRVLLYHKPEGEIVSRDDPERRATVFDRLPRLRGAKWLAVGRLDYNSGGLLVLTTSGELANRMTHPRYELTREYAVRIRGRVATADMERLVQGIRLEDGPARVDTIEEQGGEGANRWYRVELHEGRNREVRRLFEALGLTVSRLMRIRFGPLVLPPRLTRGHYAELPPEEVGELLAAVGLAQEPQQINRQARPEHSRRDRPDRQEKQERHSNQPRRGGGRGGSQGDINRQARPEHSRGGHQERQERQSNQPRSYGERGGSQGDLNRQARPEHSRRGRQDHQQRQPNQPRRHGERGRRGGKPG